MKRFSSVPLVLVMETHETTIHCSSKQLNYGNKITNLKQASIYPYNLVHDDQYKYVSLPRILMNAWNELKFSCTFISFNIFIITIYLHGGSFYKCFVFYDWFFAFVLNFLFWLCKFECSRQFSLHLWNLQSDSFELTIETKCMVWYHCGKFEMLNLKCEIVLLISFKSIESILK